MQGATPRHSQMHFEYCRVPQRTQQPRRARVLAARAERALVQAVGLAHLVALARADERRAERDRHLRVFG
eukprot:6629325-Prymnesium_polylepis.1